MYKMTVHGRHGNNRMAGQGQDGHGEVNGGHGEPDEAPTARQHNTVTTNSTAMGKTENMRINGYVCNKKGMKKLGRERE